MWYHHSINRYHKVSLVNEVGVDWVLDLVNIIYIAFGLKLVSVGRRERDHSEAERAQHIAKIHELQEHIQEKERQLMDLQEQVCFI